MTPATARTAANVLIGTAAAAAAIVIVAKPPLRRMAFRAVRLWLGASVPVYLATQARQAWVESGRAA